MPEPHDEPTPANEPPPPMGADAGGVPTRRDAAGEFAWESVLAARHVPPTRDERGDVLDVAYPAPEMFESVDESDDPRALGPVVSPRPPDPWRHRRAEPRLFAFLWTLYLLASVLGSLMWVAKSSVLAGSAYGPAARTMLLLIITGALLLWPMVRLSQLRPQGSLVAAGLLDFVVVAFPIQLIVWPLIFLASWRVDAVAAVALLAATWPALTGGILVLFQTFSRRAAGSMMEPLLGVIGMLLLLMLIVSGPLWLVLAPPHGSNGHGLAWTFSPLTHMFRLTGSGMKGPVTPVARLDFVILSGVGGAALVLWILAGVLDRGCRRRADGLD